MLVARGRSHSVRGIHIAYKKSKLLNIIYVNANAISNIAYSSAWRQLCDSEKITHELRTAWHFVSKSMPANSIYKELLLLGFLLLPGVVKHCPYILSKGNPSLCEFVDITYISFNIWKPTFIAVKIYCFGPIPRQLSF